MKGYLIRDVKMIIRITTKDEEAFTADEIKAVTRQVYGNPVLVEVLPDGDTPKDHIYFGVQQLITSAHLDLVFEHNNDNVYKEKLTELKRGVLANLEKIINQVIVDNEAKLQGE